LANVFAQEAVMRTDVKGDSSVSATATTTDATIKDITPKVEMPTPVTDPATNDQPLPTIDTVLDPKIPDVAVPTGGSTVNPDTQTDTQGPPPPQTQSTFMDTIQPATNAETKMLPKPDEATGAMVYSYQIEVPPGRGEMTPDISLVYNSQKKDLDSEFGYGWSVSIPHIERLNKTGVDKLYTDNYFTSSIDGELVDLGSGVYVPKVESGDFLKYEFGSNAWTVTDKKGTVYKFGVTADAQQDDSPTSPSMTYKWMLEEVRDTNDNYIEYAYSKDGTSNQIYPETITYTGNGSTPGIFTVNFTSTTSVRTDENISYKPGFRVTTSYLINTITTKINSDVSHVYELDYSTQTENGITLLTGISETGYDTNSTATDPRTTSFSYSVNSTITWDEDTNLQPLSGLEILPSNSNPRYELRDWNGDGLADKIGLPGWGYVWDPGQSSLYTMSVELNENGTTVSSPTNVALPTRVNSGNTALDFFLHDLNGDAKLDLVGVEAPTGSLYATYINTGSGWAADTNYDVGSGPVYGMPSGLSPSPTNSFPSFIFDINGDNLPDLVYAHCNSNQYSDCTTNSSLIQNVSLNTGSGWQPASWTFPTDTNLLDVYFSSVPSSSPQPQDTRAMDVNGDGLVDLVNFVEGMGVYPTSSVQEKIFLNTGSGWEEEPGWDIPTDAISSYGSWVTNYDNIDDFNADGLPDLIKNVADTGSFACPSDQSTSVTLDTKTWLMTSGSLWQDNSTGPYLPDWHYTGTNVNPDAYLGVIECNLQYPFQIVDVDGDTLPDVISRRFTGSGPTALQAEDKVFRNTGIVPDLLTGIGYPTGGTTSIGYKASTQYKDTNGDLLNPHLPMQMIIVDSITNTDHPSVSTTSGTNTYSYEGGNYFYDTPTNRKFAGFSVVTKTEPAGNVTKTYFHQGDPANTDNVAVGDIDDSEWKIGKPYRVEQYDDNSNLIKVTVTKWGEDQIGSSDAYFVHADSTATLTYEGDTSHKDTGEEFTYDTANGNPLTHVEWGEVTAAADGSFTDSGTDDRTTSYDYASPIGSTNVIGLPSHQIVLDHSSSTVKETNYYYDGQSLNDVDLGNLTSQEDRIDGSTWATSAKTYDSTYGLVDSVTDANNNTTSYSPDAYYLYPQRVTNALSQRMDYSYDYATGKVINTVDVNGYQFTTQYDGLGRPIEVLIPDGGTGSATKTTYTYDDINLPNSVLKSDYRNGTDFHDTYTFVDGIGRSIQTRSQAENSGDYVTTDTIYDSTGRVLNQSLLYFSTGAGYTAPIIGMTPELYSTYTYDPLGRVLSLANILGSTDYEYDDWQTSVTDPDMHVKNYLSDAYGNLIEVQEVDATNAAIYHTYYEWSLAGKLTKITDDLGNIRTFIYNIAGDRIVAEDLHSTTDMSIGVWTYQYDDFGNMKLSVDPNGVSISYDYDALNRLLTEDDLNTGGADITYTYDTSCTNGVGRLCIVTMATGATVNYDYDQVGNIASDARSMWSNNYTTDYTYDYQNNITNIIYPDSSEVAYSYNAAGQIEDVQHKPSGGSFASIISNIDYAPTGGITVEAYANGVMTTNTYDGAALYRLQNKLTTDGITNFQDISYEYNDGGSIRYLHNYSGTGAYQEAAYTYDDLDRLIEAVVTSTGNTADYTDTFDYNSLGNIISYNTISYAYNGNSITGSYANPHAPTTVNSIAHDYDNAGNLIDDGTNTYTWDYRNQLAQAITPLKTIDFTYDQTGGRMSTYDGTTATITPNRYFETDQTNDTDYIYLGDQLVASVDTNGTHYIHADHLTGSSIITDAYPKEEQLLDYHPYGDVRINDQLGSLDLKKKFTGHEYDADTDLNYMGARYYQAKRGQFLSEDPVFWAMGDESRVKENAKQEQTKLLMNPQAMNSYAYANDNPLKNIDQDGKSAATAAFFYPFASEQDKMDLGAAALQMGPGWQWAMDHPAAASTIVAVGSVPALLSGGSAAAAFEMAAYTGVGASFAGQQIVAGTIYTGLSVSSTKAIPAIIDKFSSVDKSKTSSYYSAALSVTKQIGPSVAGGYVAGISDAIEVGKSVANFITSLFSPSNNQGVINYSKNYKSDNKK